MIPHGPWTCHGPGTLCGACEFPLGLAGGGPIAAELDIIIACISSRNRAGHGLWDYSFARTAGRAALAEWLMFN